MSMGSQEFVHASMKTAMVSVFRMKSIVALRQIMSVLCTAGLGCAMCWFLQGLLLLPVARPPLLHAASTVDKIGLGSM